ASGGWRTGGVLVSVAVLCRGERQSAGGGAAVGAISTSSSIRRSGEARLHGAGVAERNCALAVGRWRFSRVGRARDPVGDRALPVIRGLAVSADCTVSLARAHPCPGLYAE